MILTFKKTEDGLWYINLPEYIEQGGHPEDLQMVLGADSLLDDISGGDNFVTVEISNIASLASFQIKEHAHIGLTKIEQSEMGGAYYTVDSNKFCPKKLHTKLLWLCPVTLFVFEGKYPKFIGVKIIN